MSLQFCPHHNQPKDFICAKNQCNQLICKQCFKSHASISKHGQAVRLSLDSKQFFLKWTDFILQKLVKFSQIVTHMGYSKVFQMKLQLNHPKGTVSQLSFQEIQQIAVQALQQHRKITEGNLTFIKGTYNITEMIHPQFLKDLYNIACEDAKFNLDILLSNIQKKLIDAYPHKQIYKYSKFNIFPKEIVQLQEYRKSLVHQFEQMIMLRDPNLSSSPKRHKINSPNQKNSLEIQDGSVNQFKETKQRRFSTEYQSSSQNHLPDVSKIQEQKHQILKSDTKRSYFTQQPKLGTNISTQQNPSPTPKEVDQSPRKIKHNHNIQNQVKVENQRLKVTVALLRSNEIMYEQKVSALQRQNKLLRQKVEAIQKVPQGHKLNNQQKVDILLNNEIQTPLRKQLEQLQIVQARLVEENTQLNRALKDLQAISQGRSITIVSLEEQIKRFTDHIQLKQKSIQQLNQLISNQEEQIAYRQNQAQILEQEIKKLMSKIKFLEESIHQLNNLVSNEQQEISYRENQVQTLQQEINKLLNRIKDLQNSIKSLNSLIVNQEEELAYRQNQSDILEKEVKKLLQKIAYLQKCIHQLNNLISNEQEEIAYRQNESQTLANEVRNLVEKNKILEKQILSVKQQLNQTNNSLRQTATSSSNQNNSQDLNEQLLEQVIELEADIQNKNDDIQLLISIVQEYFEKIISNSQGKTQQGAHVLTKLKGLKTVNMKNTK